MSDATSLTVSFLHSVTRITSIQNGQQISIATGFFYARNEDIYLVTNRHVVLDNARPDTLRVRLHSDPNDMTRNTDFDIPLSSRQQVRWHDHPDYRANGIDIAVVEVDRQALENGHVFTTLSALHFLHQRFAVLPAEDVMIIGFPEGYSDRLHNLPVIRNAMISSVYGIDFDGEPYFLVDANLHCGMSGSPVITKPKSSWPTNEGIYRYTSGSVYFLGVLSSEALYPPGRPQPLGLGHVWYAHLIEEIIDSFGGS